MTSAPGSSWSRDASAGRGSRTSRASTRELGSRPRRRISSVNESRLPAWRWTGGSATNVPRPGTR